MKKNLRIVSLAAAALLAVSPVVASASNIANADVTVNVGSNNGNGTTGTTTTQAPQNKPYFTYNDQAVGEATNDNPYGNVIPTTMTISKNETLKSVMDKVVGLVKFHNSNDSNGQTIKLTTTDFINQLENNHVKVDTYKSGKNKGAHYISSVPANSFNLVLSASYNNQTASVQIPVVTSGSDTTPTVNDSPVIGWSVNGSQQTDNNKKVASVNGQVFQVAVGSQFNPTDFTNSNGERITISAQQNANNSTFASVSATSNPVNTSEAGRYYNVTLTATGLTGKTTTATYTVLITSSAKQPLYGNGTIQTYSIYGINVLPNSTTFKTGDQVYVADGTRTINNVSYSKVSTKSKSDAEAGNTWVKTSDLTKPATPAETSESHTVMVTSRAYDKNGNYLGHQYDAYTTINIVPTVVTINGKTYYKVAGKDEYVRVTNITGTHRTLRHNAYIYWSSYRRTPGTGKAYRGQSVTTYGAAIRFKNGKRYYRIDGCRPTNKRYIKQANFF